MAADRGEGTHVIPSAFVSGQSETFCVVANERGADHRLAAAVGGPGMSVGGVRFDPGAVGAVSDWLGRIVVVCGALAISVQWPIYEMLGSRASTRISQAPSRTMRSRFAALFITSRNYSPANPYGRWTDGAVVRGYGSSRTTVPARMSWRVRPRKSKNMGRKPMPSGTMLSGRKSVRRSVCQIVR